MIGGEGNFVMNACTVSASTRRRRRPTVLRRARAGTAVVEMAVVTPVLLALAFGCTDFGRIFHAYAVVSNAARCGAEYGALHNFTNYTRDSWETAVRNAVESDMQGLAGYQSQQLDVAIATTTDADGLFRVAVQVTYPFQTVVSWPGLPSPVSLTHRLEMRRIH